MGRFFVRILVVFIAVLAAMSILRGALSQNSAPKRAQPRRTPERTGKLVRDPVCGTYVTATSSLTVRHDSETFFFCSEDCRDTFLARTASEG